MHRFSRTLIFVTLVTLLSTGWADELVVSYEGRALDQPTFGVYLLPGQTFSLQTSHAVDVTFDGTWHSHGANEIELTAPTAPGEFEVRLQSEQDDPFTVTAFVMHPFEDVDGGQLNGYRIGNYPTTPLENNLNYRPPNGFVQVTMQNRNRQISPSFTLGEFTSKQSTQFPKYVALRPELLLKLEQIKAAVERETRQSESIVIMSGYRTPYYNRAIGNVRYSRHVYGDAADIYFDSRPRDGIMDDLDGDGRTSKADARWLFQLVDRMHRSGELEGLTGGLGLYGANQVHGPFVHVDVRGHKARWGI